MTVARALGACLLSVLAVLLLGTSYAWAEPAPAAWECATDAATGVESCTVTAWSTPTPAPTPAGPLDVRVVQPAGEAVPVVEQSPAPAPAPSDGEALCGTADAPCVVETGVDTTTALGALGLAGVLAAGVRIAQGLRR